MNSRLIRKEYSCKSSMSGRRSPRMEANLRRFGFNLPDHEIPVGELREKVRASSNIGIGRLCEDWRLETTAHHSLLVQGVTGYLINGYSIC